MIFDAAFGWGVGFADLGFWWLGRWGHLVQHAAHAHIHLLHEVGFQRVYDLGRNALAGNAPVLAPLTHEGSEVLANDERFRHNMIG